MTAVASGPTRTWKKILASTVLVLFACAEEEPEIICVPDSGDTELKLGAAVIGVNSSDTIDFYFREVGASYLYIDGECRWWANPSQWDMRETRTGVLSQEQVKSISAQVQYRAWNDWNGQLWDNASTSHFGVAAFYRPGSWFACAGGCDLIDSVESITKALWTDAESVTGGIWAWTDDTNPPVDLANILNGRKIYDWPFSVTYEQLLVEVQTLAEDDRYPAYLETDPDAVKALRKIRLEHDRATDGYFLFFAINDSQGITVHIRDAIPIENDLGFIEEVW